jgi:F-type H+-transporting ATPase subunit b
VGQVFAAFGIDWRLLLINAVNFALLMLALWYFLYGPLMRILEERRQKVAQGVRDAEAAKAHLKEIEDSRAEVLAQAGQEADDVLAKTRAAAAAREKEILAQGEAAAQALLKEAEARAEELKHQSLEESKRELAKLVVLGIEKTATHHSS